MVQPADFPCRFMSRMLKVAPTVRQFFAAVSAPIWRWYSVADGGCVFGGSGTSRLSTSPSLPALHTISNWLLLHMARSILSDSASV